MNFTTILFISLAAIFALGIAFFQYLYKSGTAGSKKYIFFGLRFFSVFLLLLLIINPKFTFTEFLTEKPELILAADNSASIAHLEQGDSLRAFREKIDNHPEIKTRFDLTSLNFGKEINQSNSLNFEETQTDIHAVLNKLKDLFRTKKSVLILLTDGNQTLGREYKYFKSRENLTVIPTVLGDTSTFADLELDRLNVNRYAFLNNRFPVEAIVNYTGTQAVKATFEIRAGETVLYSEDVNFDAENNSRLIETTLPANSLGVLSYEAEISPLESEKNTENNQRKFAVEVVDERTNVLLLTSIIHPDLGLFKKAVESNQQRKLDVKLLEDNNYNMKEYQLIILYQPDNSFRNVLEEITNENISRFIITGTKTNWNFLNSAQEYFKKDFTAQPQEISAVVNKNFGRFQFEDIGFNEFPPLEDYFGNIKASGLESILFQQIEGVETKQPLLAFSGNSNEKFGVLFGENIWRWRAAAFRETNSFEAFDDFLGKIIQNLSSRKQRERLSVDYESFYYGNEEIRIDAQYFDENYQFDPGGNLIISIKNTETGEETNAALSFQNNNYSISLENLKEGDYSFELTEEDSGIFRSGNFSIIAFDVEAQFSSANFDDLQELAQNNGQEVFFANQPDALITKLLNDEQFKPVQKSRENKLSLIDWYYLLFLLVLLLATEWFYRKYLGLI